MPIGAKRAKKLLSIATKASTGGVRFQIPQGRDAPPCGGMAHNVRRNR